MASDNAPAPLSRRQTSKGDAFREYARLRFDERTGKSGPMTKEEDREERRIRKIIEEEEGRISKIRGRFENKPSKLKLLEHVAESRKELIPYLSGEAKKDKENRTKRERHLSSHDEQEAARSNESINGTERPLNELEEPVDEFKAGIMYFEKEDDGKWLGRQYEDVDSSSGEFPNQKIKMDAILSNTTKNRKLFERDEKTIRYFHFPANHMEWIETALGRYYEVNKKNLGNEEESDEYENQLLSFEYWRGQLHGAGIGKDLFHLRHMRPRCAHVSDHANPDAPSNIALFFPYLHWETNRRRAKMVQIVQELVEDNRPSLNSRWFDAAREKAPCLRQKFNREGIKNKVARYLYDIAQMWDAMDYEADERLLRQSFSQENQRDVTAGSNGPKNMKWEPPLHIRRTLDQSYFSILEDTTARDTDQVVYRQTRARQEKHKKHQEDENGGINPANIITPSQSQHNGSDANTHTSTTLGSTTSSDTVTEKKKKDKITKLIGVTRVVMVDQLWMWILGEDTIITSFPRRWGRNKPDSSGVHKSLRQILKKRKRIRSIYHLATLIIDQCSKVFFDRTQPTDDRPEVMDLFAQAIGTVAYNTTSAYSLFWANVSLQSPSIKKEEEEEEKKKKNISITEWFKYLGINPENYRARNRESLRYLNINPEGVLLKESQDITEELNMMERVYKQQLAVVNELQKHMKSRHDKVKRTSGEAPDSSQNQNKTNITQIDLDEAADLTERIQNRIDEIADYQKAVTRTNEQLQALLSLKQQEASIVEARTALERADESVQQGRAIMAFTIVTIFFLPLGFFAGVFGMNNSTSTGDEWMSLREQIMYMFVISAVVISVVLVVAFRWRSDNKPNNKLISYEEAIERHKKARGNEQKSNSPSGSDTTERLENATARFRFGREKTNASEV